MIASFIRDECVVGGEAFVSTEQLRASFNAWADEHGADRLDSKKFAPLMRAKGYDKKAKRCQGNLHQCFIGLALRPEAVPENDEWM